MLSLFIKLHDVGSDYDRKVYQQLLLTSGVFLDRLRENHAEWRGHRCISSHHMQTNTTYFLTLVLVLMASDRMDLDFSNISLAR